MSSQNMTVSRTNFASRLLSKAMSDRTKQASKDDKLTPADAARYAAPAETSETAATTKS